MSPAESDTGSALPRWVVDPSAAHKSTEEPVASGPEVQSGDRPTGQDQAPVHRSGGQSADRELPPASEFVPIDAPRIASDNADEGVQESASKNPSKNAPDVASELAPNDRLNDVPNTSTQRQADTDALPTLVRHR